MADLEAVLADVSYLMAMEKSKSTPAARASKKIMLPDPRWVQNKYIHVIMPSWLIQLYCSWLGYDRCTWARPQDCGSWLLFTLNTLRECYRTWLILINVVLLNVGCIFCWKRITDRKVRSGVKSLNRPTVVAIGGPMLLWLLLLLTCMHVNTLTLEIKQSKFQCLILKSDYQNLG